jgi:hypothetical protein
MAILGASAAQRIRWQVVGDETALIALFAPPGKVEKYCQPITILVRRNSRLNLFAAARSTIDDWQIAATTVSPNDLIYRMALMIPNPWAIKFQLRNL